MLPSARKVVACLGLINSARSVAGSSRAFFIAPLLLPFLIVPFLGVSPALPAAPAPGMPPSSLSLLPAQRPPSDRATTADSSQTSACIAPTSPPSLTTRPLVSTSSPTEAAHARYLPVAAMSWSVDGLPELAGISATIQEVLEHNAVRFRGTRGDYYTFLPGTLYGEVYFRDLVTTAKIAQNLYGESFLRSALEELLATQLTTVPKEIPLGPDAFPGPGALYGYLSSDGRGEKTTTVSDEEASAIQLAYLYFKSAGGVDWLNCSIGGQTIMYRLNLAMDRLVRGRLEPKSGLIKRAHTTDWGDIRFQSVIQPTQADPRFEYWTASIYDQAWTYLALKQLIEMNRAASQQDAAEHWQQIAEGIRGNTQRLLWQPQRGYYRIHYHITPLLHDFSEDSMVAIGNAVALYAGLADESQAQQIIAALEIARLRSGSVKPGVSIYPPYPEDYFLHPLMREEGVYQNGGVWDWWGGIQITAEFEAGYGQLAWQHLTAVARDWARHPNEIAEWHIPSTNQMGGSGQYAGAAGTVGEAVVRGLFGIQLTRDGFTLRPRLGSRNGQMQVGQPASGYSLWMRYRVTDDTISVQYNTNHQNAGTLAIMLPPGAEPEAVLLDETPLPIVTKTVGQDRYLEVGTVPSGAHAVEVRMRAKIGIPLAVAWGVHTIPSALPSGQAVTVQMAATNAGTASWQQGGSFPVRMGYRWLDMAGRPLPADAVPDVHSTLPSNLAPGSSVVTPLALHTPPQSGLYRLQVDMIQEYVVWFHEAAIQNRPLELLVRVAE